jgi:phenylalanyl-tRNA synthetase beta chain
MKLPLSWLREFVEVPVEPERLGEDLTLRGFALESLEKHGGDAVLDVEVTTNRVDCMNVYGLAREAAVIYQKPLRPLELALDEAGAAAEEALEVVIEAPDLCPRFCARVLDVRLGPSPAWLRERLESVGVRPINNVVDLTNYVMMEMGHPSHAFDLERIPGGRLHVRWGREGESLVTLDGTLRALSGRTGVVAGPEAPLALAGIMGGASSEVSEATRVVALEAAWWEPLAIRRAARALGMRSEASHRFERGADTEGPPAATARIAHLLRRIGAGTVRPGLIDRHPAPRPRRALKLRHARTDALLGCQVPPQSARRILTGLGFALGDASEGAVTVEVPTWRGDVSREIDLVEEVGRHHGLDNVPSTLPPARGGVGLRPSQLRERKIREVMVGAGLDEVINYAFVPESPVPGGLGPAVGIANPLAEDQGVLRRSLVVPGLLASLQANLRQGRRDVRLFELGRVFTPGAAAPLEEPRLGILLAGAARPAHWSERPRTVDCFDLKGLFEALSRRLGLSPMEVLASGAPSFLHPGKSASLRMGGETIGYFGALHPDFAAKWELRDETLAGELALGTILPQRAAPARFMALERFPAVERDLSIVAEASLAAAELLETVRASGGALLRSVTVRDRYEGPPVPPGRVSLTITLRYQDPARTLTGEEVLSSVERVIERLRARGAEIRGE